MPKQFQFGFCKHYTTIVNKVWQPISVLLIVFVHLLGQEWIMHQHRQRHVKETKLRPGRISDCISADCAKTMGQTYTDGRVIIIISKEIQQLQIKCIISRALLSFQMNMDQILYLWTDTKEIITIKYKKVEMLSQDVMVEGRNMKQRNVFSLQEVIPELSLKEWQQVDEDDGGEGHSKPERAEICKFTGKITKTKTRVFG